MPNNTTIMTNGQTSRLLQLPRELRDMILGPVIVHGEDVKLFNHEHFTRAFTAETPSTPPSLMHVCAQLRCEAAEMWYGMNTLRVHSLQQLLDLIDYRADHHRYLRRVRLFNSATPDFDQAAAIAAAADRTCSLRPGTVKVISSNNHPKPAEWLCFFVDAHGAKEQYNNDCYYADLDQHYWATQDRD